MYSIRFRNILLLFGLIATTFYSECKSQNSANNSHTKTDSIWKECKINEITKIGNGYIIVAEDKGFIFKIVSPQFLDHIKFRRDFNIKRDRATIQVGESYRFKLRRLYPPSDNFIYGVRVTAIIHYNCTIELELGVSYFSTECLEGLEIIPENCQ